MKKNKQVCLVLHKGHPHRCMYQTLKNGELIAITEEGIMVDADQVSDETLKLPTWIDVRTGEGAVLPPAGPDETGETGAGGEGDGDEGAGDDGIVSHREGPEADANHRGTEVDEEKPANHEGAKGTKGTKEKSAPGKTKAPAKKAPAKKAPAKKAPAKKPVAKKPASKKAKK